MRLYSVHLRQNGLRPERDLVLVKEGFSWPAFLFTFLWALVHRMWLPAAGFFAAVALAGLAAAAFLRDETLEGIVTFAVAAAVGFVAADVRRWWLDRKGFDEVALVVGRDEDEALRRFLDEADVTPAGIFAGGPA